MKISLNWLKKYLEIDMDPEELSEILTIIGLEVEGMEVVEAVKGGLKGVVVGAVTACEKHPGADRLSLTKVNTGEAEELSIVCGAPNVAVGQKVFVATIGTTLYNGEGEGWKIKKGKIRGELSEGMICAEDELGLGNNHDGIMVLDKDATIGMPAYEYLNLENDIVFDIGLTPNRSDATSHVGCARDLAAYLAVNRDFGGDIKLPDVQHFEVGNESYKIDVEVQNTESCPRYSGIVIENVKIKESPDWIKTALKSIGVRPISNIVDITNYVLHELGQPLHAFDADKISGNKVIVRNLDKDTEFISLDEQTRKLHEEDLMICDGDSKGMCIAGVFGGIGSGVTENTKNIFLESAHFEAGSIRRTSTRHLLRTDAAKVFEKGSDPNITVYALKRAALLIAELAEGKIASEIVDVYPAKIERREIILKLSKVTDVIGIEITEDEIYNILRAMNMEIVPVDEETIKVKVPTDKADVTRDVDLIEEILRIYGFNRIPIPSKISSTIHYSESPNVNQVKEKVADFLASNGYNEMMGLSLIESRHFSEVLPIPEDKMVFINNTSNIHLDIMRPDMMISGLLSILHNQNRQQQFLRLFEFGKTYQTQGETFEETDFLTLFISGRKREESWHYNKEMQKEVDFYDIKKAVLGLFTRLGISKFQITELEENRRFSYGLKFHRGKQILALLGQVSPVIGAKMGLKKDVFYAEIPFRNLFDCLKSVNYNVSEINKYPSVRRDLALVVDDSTQFDEIIRIARSADKKFLRDINLFDVYANESQLGKGKKSYAVSFVFESSEKTLSDKEVDKVMKKMIREFEEKLSAIIRK